MRTYKPSEFISAMLHSDMIKKVEPEGKVCTDCQEYKAIDEYSKKSNAPDGRYQICKKCKAIETNKKYHAKKAEREMFNCMPI